MQIKLDIQDIILVGTYFSNKLRGGLYQNVLQSLYKVFWYNYFEISEADKEETYDID